MALDTLQDLFLEQLRDTLSAEQQLVKALPKMSKHAHSAALGQALDKHLEETQQQVARLEQVFDMIGERPKAKKCKGMQGLIEEGQEALDEEGNSAVLDAAIIAAAKRVEHYEIAAYGCLVRYAEMLGHTDAVGLLKVTLQEERRADEKLTGISESEVLSTAASAATAAAM